MTISQAVIAALDRIKGCEENKSVLGNFLQDVVKNLARKKQGHRFHQSTKDLFSVLLTRCPFAGRYLQQNLGAPSVSVLRENIRADRVDMLPGLHGTKAICAGLGNIVKKKLDALGYDHGSVLWELSEDDTILSAVIEYDVVLCCFVGTCGVDGDDHQCCTDPVPMEFTGRDAYSKFRAFVQTQRRAHCKPLCAVLCSCLFKVVVSCCSTDVSVCLLNPLVEGLKPMIVYFGFHCNTKKTEDHLERWISIEELFIAEGLEESCGVIVCVSTDGDPSKRSGQKKRMTVPGGFKPIDHEAFPWTLHVNGVGIPHRYGNQDPIQ